MRGQRAAHGDAFALGDIFPGIALIIGGRRARAAGAGARGAIILAGERYAKAFFLGTGRLGSGGR